MTKTIIKCLLLIILTISTGFCDPPKSGTPKIGDLLQTNTIDDIDWRDKSYAQLFGEKETEETAAFGGQKFLSPKKAFMFSFLIPGAGEFYAKSYVKSALFVVLEAGLWTGMSAFHSSGVNRRNAYEDFHDRNFDPDLFLDWYAIVTDSFQIERFPEQLPHNDDDWYDVIKDHDYYEMTGKYPYFLLGWKDIHDRIMASDDRDPLLDQEADDAVLIGILADWVDSSAAVNKYMDDRKKANDMFIFSKYCLGAAIFNHIVSAFDAAWTAHRKNEAKNKGFSDRIHAEPGLARTCDGGTIPEIKLLISLK